MVKKHRAPLTVVGSSPPAPDAAPAGLGPAGVGLWHRITGEYDIGDEAGRELLFQACCSCDRANELKQAIDVDGATIHTRTGPRVHPALKAELEARSFVVRTLHRLGLDVEPLRNRPGRPATGIGILWKDEDEENDQ